MKLVEVTLGELDFQQPVWIKGELWFIKSFNDVGSENFLLEKAGITNNDGSCYLYADPEQQAERKLFHVSTRVLVARMDLADVEEVTNV